MAFLLFEKNIVDGQARIRPKGTTFSLAGYNLIYRSWIVHGSPVDTGWHTTADELIQILTDQLHNHQNQAPDHRF